MEEIICILLTKHEYLCGMHWQIINLSTLLVFKRSRYEISKCRSKSSQSGRWKNVWSEEILQRI